jgi:agmatinase
MTTFDPNAPAAAGSGIFGLPFTEAESSLVLLPVPWEATTSYGGGTSRAPAAIRAASHQVDLFDLDFETPYAPGIFMRPEAAEVIAWNARARAAAERVIEVGGEIAGVRELEEALAEVNELSAMLNAWVKKETLGLLAKGKTVALVGGDHSTPFGALAAVGEKLGKFGVLHFDAHSDTRIAYEGFVHSHASIMYNALQGVKEIEKLVQVGIRDVCEQEISYTRSQGERVRMFTDRELARRAFSGETFSKIAADIVAALPQRVWVSFDIDGLDPRFCPHTGTPVPGGLDFREASYILAELVKSGRELVGFDVNEVAPSLANDEDEWDANVGARLLYKLCGATFASQKKIKVSAG